MEVAEVKGIVKVLLAVVGSHGTRVTAVSPAKL